MDTLDKLEEQAKKEAVRVNHLTGFPKERIAQLPEPLYCFTEEELKNYKQALQEDLDLQKAEQQLVGFRHARQGYGLIDLVEAMGLTAEEWEKLKEEIHAPLEWKLELDEHFSNDED